MYLSTQRESMPTLSNAGTTAPIFSNAATLPARTVPDVFNATVNRRGDAVAIRQIVPNAMAASVIDRFSEISYTWNEYRQRAQQFGKALIANGVNPQTGVTIQGANAPQWLFAHLGTILAGGVSVGSYATNNATNSQHVVTDSESAVVVVENEQQLQKYAGMKSTAVKAFVVWNNVMNSELQDQLPAPVYQWNKFLQQGQNVSGKDLEARMAAQKPDQVTSLIYTSGTTGLPKGAELTHDNLTWTASVAGRQFSVADEDQGLSYLPLNHIAAQQLDAIVPLTHGYAINIAPGDALKGTNLRQHIVKTRPTYFLAVPRVWEKFKEAIELKLSLASPFKREMFNFAKTAVRFSKIKPFEGSTKLTALVNKVYKSVSGCFLALAERFVLTPLKTSLGLDRARITATGAAPSRPDVREFFESLNISVVDQYGLSESSGPVTLSVEGDVPVGSVGRAMPGTELIIADPNERGIGEIRVRGRNVFKGYWHNAEKTKQAFDQDGFLRTGDLGRLDSDGNLFITGRQKELIITSGGENIAPVEIEASIQRELGVNATVVVTGDQRNYLTALVALETLEDDEGRPTNRLTPVVIQALIAAGSTATTLEEAAADDKVSALMMEGINRANREAPSHAQRIQKVAIIPDQLSVDNGTLTPTLKLKRKSIAERYAQQIESMYAPRS
ncbi:Long-chain-fatty-acid--CoA ligase ACSBG2 [Chlamydiales bacterium SCGC AG-110-P3]|nr:Long-chain-fatty-acid--CoA ligase ACSBG2 [Chlamydiales bacterium SCGC AG-110-P3]